MKFIGFKISTTLRDNKQKEDIPPFYHKIYDNNKLDVLKSGSELKMYCIFDLHKNQEDFDYYVAVENNTVTNEKNYAEIQIPAGRYLEVEVLKRNNKTVNIIMMYVRKIWMMANGYAERKAPPFILYDERFHKNYQKFGCKGDDYLGNPLATLYLPIES